MKNKLFLSLSLLTMAFSAQATFLSDNSGIMLNQTLKAMVPSMPAMFKAEALYRLKPALNLAQSAKVGAIVALPTAVVAGGLYAIDKVSTKPAVQPETRLQRAKAYAADTRAVKALASASSYVANTRAAQALVTAGTFTKDQAVKAGSFVKANTWNRSLFGYKNGGKYATAGAGLVTAAGLTYLAYNKGLFGKTKKATNVVVAPVKGRTPSNRG